MLVRMSVRKICMKSVQNLHKFRHFLAIFCGFGLFLGHFQPNWEVWDLDLGLSVGSRAWIWAISGLFGESRACIQGILDLFQVERAWIWAISGLIYLSEPWIRAFFGLFVEYEARIHAISGLFGFLPYQTYVVGYGPIREVTLSAGGEGLKNWAKFTIEIL